MHSDLELGPLTDANGGVNAVIGTHDNGQNMTKVIAETEYQQFLEKHPPDSWLMHSFFWRSRVVLTAYYYGHVFWFLVVLMLLPLLQKVNSSHSVLAGLLISFGITACLLLVAPNQWVWFLSFRLRPGSTSKQVRRFAKRRPRFWGWLWAMVFLFGNLESVFMPIFLSCWERHFWGPDPGNDDTREPLSFILYIDSERPIEVPCGSSMSDKAIVAQISRFFYAQLMARPLYHALSLKTLGHVEIIEICDGFPTGKRDCTVDFGKNMHNRQIKYFRKWKKLDGTNFLNTLKRDGVVSSCNNQKIRAINMVTTWHAWIVSAVVLAPSVLAIMTAILWPEIAVLKFHEDPQTSIQTGFTIAGFIVTIGALLAVLVTYASVPSEHDVKVNKGEMRAPIHVLPHDEEASLRDRSSEWARNRPRYMPATRETRPLSRNFSQKERKPSMAASQEDLQTVRPSSAFISGSPQPGYAQPSAFESYVPHAHTVYYPPEPAPLWAAQAPPVSGGYQPVPASEASYPAYMQHQ